MDILTFCERPEQRLVTRQMRHDAQFDLRIVGGNHDRALARNEGLPDSAPLIRSHRNVLQVRVAGAQAPRRRDSLVVGGMHAPGRGIDHAGKLVCIGRSQFRKAPMLQDQCRQFVSLVRQLLQHALGRRGRALRRFCDNREIQFLEEDLADLFW